MTHFKGHEQAGFGGALKNLGMGAAAVPGKLELHASAQPKIDTANCIGCNICVKHCAHDAVHLNADRKAEIDYSKCVGCGQCVALCQHDGAVVGSWDTSENMNYKIAEYTKAVLKDKPHFHVSFVMNVSPECDCWNHNDAAIIPDLGILASTDPVALDQACADLVNQTPVLHGNNVLGNKHEHDDLLRLRQVPPHPPQHQLAGRTGTRRSHRYRHPQLRTDCVTHKEHKNHDDEYICKTLFPPVRERKNLSICPAVRSRQHPLPQLCHLLPLGGPTLLPIYFFTLVAAYKFGLRVGLLTAVLSPVVNHLLFAMPAAAVLPAILIKSTLLAVAASIVARRAKDKVLFGGLLAAVLAYQVVGTGFEWLLCGDFHLAAQDFRIGVPGMLLQWLGGYWVLRALARK